MPVHPYQGLKVQCALYAGVGADLNLTHRADPILTRGWMPTP